MLKSEYIQNGNAYIGEVTAHAQRPCRQAQAVNQERNIFPSVVSARIGRVAAVVGGNDQEVGRTK